MRRDHKPAALGQWTDSLESMSCVTVTVVVSVNRDVKCDHSSFRKIACKTLSHLRYSSIETSAASQQRTISFTSNKEHVMSQLDKLLYTAKTHTTGGRDGASRSSDGRLDVKLSSPGTAGTGTNPEQLFAVGWSACFMSAMALAASKMKVALPPERAVDAEVDLGMIDGGYVLRARLNVSLPGIEREVARAVADAAHQICPYSKATRGNIDVEINLV